MEKRTIRIIEEKRVYDGYNKIDEALIEDSSGDGNISQYVRQKIVRPDAVTGLIYNIDTECVVLVKQHRYPTQKGKRIGFTYEAVAGKIDKQGEDPKQTFIRECLEETGYKLKEKNVEFCFWCFSSPGYSTERVHYFIATARNKDRVLGAGGGVKDDNENIEVCEIHYLQFRSMMDTMEDAKTKLLAYEAHYKNLFDRNNN
jgi:nudix-type nucleoside diphosphatase (YffH/AdpP family)